MEEKEFDELVGRLRRSTLPPCPGFLESNVLRRIRLKRNDAESPWAWLLNWVPRPTVALATLAVVSLSSLATATVAVHAQENERSAQARVALGFDAFTAPHHLGFEE